MRLRTRVWIGFTVIAITVVGAGVFTVEVQRRYALEQMDDRLTAVRLPPETRIRPGGGAAPVGRPGAAPPTAAGADDESISDVFVAVDDAEGEFREVMVGQLLDDAPDLTALAEDRPSEPTHLTVDGLDGTSTFRVLFLPGASTSLDAIIAAPIDDVGAAVRTLTITLAGMAVVVLVASFGIGWWVSRHGIRPINELTGVAVAISAGERDRRAEVAGESTEADQLGHAFNVMLDERDRSEDRLRRFVADAAHELRTPLTSILGYADLYSAGGFRGEGQLDDAMRRLHFEAERMSRLAEDLLTLAKFDEERPLERSTFRVDHLASDVAELAGAAHPDHDFRVEAAGVTVDADRFRLHQALTALVDNAAQHTPAGSTVDLRVVADETSVVVSVSDDGPGLTESEAAVVFDRFARGDASRSRTSGGSGLGLSIAQAIVHAHGGHISVAATPGAGATFSMRLPFDAPTSRMGEPPSGRESAEESVEQPPE